MSEQKKDSVTTIKLSRRDWTFIGKKAGWIKNAQTNPVSDIPENDEFEDAELMRQIDEDIANEKTLEKQKEYDTNKNKKYFVTEYKIVKDPTNPKIDNYEVLMSTPVTGLEAAEKLEEEMENQHIDESDYMVYVEDEEDAGSMAI